ncbi:MAG TPA: hypothetical protein VH206_15330 [Xanthobacteraceae bacterium]|jgi:hypothetical protein|nr:hypothetical protein [Xanthobacteraceae bacterium]
MDKKIVGLLGAAAALTTMTAAAQASPAQTTEPATVTSYSDLLNPVANAGSLLQADNARRSAEQNTQVAQISVSIGHRHHHHHVVVVRHHHHHHHYHHHHHHY